MVVLRVNVVVVVGNVIKHKLLPIDNIVQLQIVVYGIFTRHVREVCILVIFKLEAALVVLLEVWLSVPLSVGGLVLRVGVLVGPGFDGEGHLILERPLSEELALSLLCQFVLDME